MHKVVDEAGKMKMKSAKKVHNTVLTKRYYERLFVCLINVVALWCSSLVMASSIVSQCMVASQSDYS